MNGDRVRPFDSETWTDEERRYFEYIDEKLASGENVGISNGKPVHAVFLIERFIRKARSRIRLFSGKLSRESDSGVPIYSDPHIAIAVLEFLSKKESNLTIVLENQIDINPLEKSEDHPLIQKIVEAERQKKILGKFELRKANDDALKYLNKYDAKTHFMILDEQAYRIETDLEEMKAYVNFGDASSVEILSAIFDRCIYPQSNSLMRINA